MVEELHIKFAPEIFNANGFVLRLPPVVCDPFVCVYVYMYAGIHIHIYTYIYMYVCIYI